MSNDSSSPPMPVASTQIVRTPVPKGQVTLFLLAYIGAFLLFIVPLSSGMALRVNELLPPGTREIALGWIMGVGALLAMFANPIFGALSDRTTSQMGMRRPWMIGGALVAVLGTVGVGFAPNAWFVGASWVLVQISINSVLAGLAAFIPDRVPEEQRAKVSALTGIAQQLSPLVGLAVGYAAMSLTNAVSWFVLTPAILGCLLVAVFVAKVKDRVLDQSQRQPLHFRTLWTAFLFSPRKNPDFGWAWLGRFLITLSFAAQTTYVVFFMNIRLGVPVNDAPAIQLMVLVGTTAILAVSATVSGSWSDKLRKRKVFVWGASGLIAVNHLILAFSHSWAPFLIASAIGAVAMGVYYSVDLALVTDVLPDKDHAAAKDMGVFNIANALPQSLAPALAPFALTIGSPEAQNYTALYLLAAVVALLAAATVWPIKSVR